MLTKHTEYFAMGITANKNVSKQMPDPLSQQILLLWNVCYQWTSKFSKNHAMPSSPFSWNTNVRQAEKPESSQCVVNQEGIGERSMYVIESRKHPGNC